MMILRAVLVGVIFSAVVLSGLYSIHLATQWALSLVGEGDAPVRARLF